MGDWKSSAIGGSDAEQTAEIFDVLLGDNLQGRKDYIVEHGNEYIDQLDVS